MLCDRDGTLVVDVPYNDDPERVELLPGVAAALDRARRAGMRVGVVSNQSGVAKGLIAADRLDAVNARLVELVGPLDVIECCPHDDVDRCACRKPGPGLVLAAVERLGVSPAACVVVGDRWSDVAAAEAAGATGVLLGDEVPHLEAAVDLVLGWRGGSCTAERPDPSPTVATRR